MCEFLGDQSSDGRQMVLGCVKTEISGVFTAVSQKQWKIGPLTGNCIQVVSCYQRR